MSTAIQTPPQGFNLRAMLEGEDARKQFALALPKHLSPDRFIRVALTALTRTPKLLECEPASFFKCLLDLSSLGIEPDGRRAHLIPRRNNRRNVTECTLIVDWKGLVELAKRSGDVSVWRAELVCEHDEFSWVNGEVTHRINFFAPRGDVRGVYSFVQNTRGDVDYEVLTLEEINAARRRGGDASGSPWETDWAEMAKKTAIRRHSKRLTLSPEIQKWLSSEDEPKPANARVVPAAVVGSTTPAFLQPQREPEQPELPTASDVDDQIPFGDAPPPPQEEAPPPRKRAPRQPAQAPATEAAVTPEVATLRAKIRRACTQSSVEWAVLCDVLVANDIIEQQAPLNALNQEELERVDAQLDASIALALKDLAPA